MPDRRNLKTEEAMALAVEHADHARSQGGRPLGAVVSWPGGYAAACDTRDISGDQTGHAAVNAIRKACQMRMGRHLREAVLHCVREPCLMCAGAAAAAGIREVCYGLPDPDGFFSSGKYRGLAESLGMVGKASVLEEACQVAAGVDGWA